MISSGLSLPVMPTCIVWDESLLAYNFGAGHPMSPHRLDLTARLVRELGLFDVEGVRLEQPYVADAADLLTVHSFDYVSAVQAASADPSDCNAAMGLGTEDNPAFAGMHEASARLVGGSLAAADAVLSGSVLHAVNFSGGMHHAGREKAAGFCVYNDAAAAVARLLDRGVQRVVYIDVDAHHGDGTQNIFWDDPRVMTISLHESGLTLFPGTGFANETGGKGAEGTAVNIALPAGTTDAGWLRAFHAVVPQLTEAFAPEVIVSQHGCDSHKDDPLTNLRISVEAQRQVALTISDLAGRLCEGRWIATGGGGYNVASVVPRSWALLISVAANGRVRPSTPVPAAWRDYVLEKHGVKCTDVMGDGADLWWRSWEVGYDPNDGIDRTVMATRKELFPLHGLDPWFD
ncbi:MULTISPECIES: acetoin utilization protein AcuC [unclassified Arthrobacter]|uniref:acetoin utilization protein AcuC n=1 Tax=unclassified Arthrobacter TaxID=235627 RepID=UPI001D14C784|nr:MULTISPECIES: acetoin utilization protein AcuC [unclassified Arthrobacter]MCC3275888.1 acetoin utilization protein AcuC [Arthrobacter sp. zg-Y20]MCC9176525.1 acetoin utilization protein AcuC [Arthrobacter sp. zg-Y750]MDK1316045.1 acetoin utilization protein AcuC [Arthrobacter sp. zg.Y20]WIB05662.1 acetoin utilization protein AcuC [Arthrobacter sp. zg-Y20]